MEKISTLPGQGENLDADTFRRVWERVMPDQTASPVALERREEGIPDTAAPAQAAPPPAEEETADGEGQTSGGDGEDQAPDLPQVPVCAGGEEQACPCTGEPALCLGEGSEGDSRRLEELMSMARRGMLAGQVLSCRGGGSCGRVMRMLAGDHRQALRRLSAAYFLITGRRFHPCCPSPELPASFSLSLREQFMWEQRWEHCNRQAAEYTQDPCLRALYEELEQEGKLHAGTIRSLLERMS